MKFVLPFLAFLPVAFGASKTESRALQFDPSYDLEEAWDISQPVITYTPGDEFFELSVVLGELGAPTAYVVILEECLHGNTPYPPPAMPAWIGLDGPDAFAGFNVLNTVVDYPNVWTLDAANNIGTVQFCVLVGNANDGVPPEMVNFRETEVTITYNLLAEWEPASFETVAMDPIDFTESQDLTAGVFTCPADENKVLWGPYGLYLYQGEVACMAICPGTEPQQQFWNTATVEAVVAVGDNGASQAIVVNGASVNNQVNVYTPNGCMAIEWVFDGEFFPTTLDDFVQVTVTGSATFLPANGNRLLGAVNRKGRALEEATNADFEAEVTLQKNPDGSGSFSAHVTKVVATAGIAGALLL